MVVKDPLMGWSFGDVGRVLMLVLCFVLACIIPYLWVLPIHYIGNYFKQKGKVVDEATFRWRLRHFWIACSLWLACDILTVVFFNYEGLISYFNDEFAGEGYELISAQHANLMIFSSFGCMAFTLALLKWEEIKLFVPKLRANVRSIWVGVGLAFLLRLGLGFYAGILKIFDIDLITKDTSGLASVTDGIISLNQFYSPVLCFLIVVILVPIYEEILFRGIFLSACQRNMKFMIANILQAGVFAVAHDEWMLFPFFIAFGMVAGNYTRKTESLITSTSMHMTNNLLAFVVILVTKS
jgi:membrane protease YdiL (CAAX protease family)